MAQPYIGEVRMFAGNFAPAGWMFCEGQLLSISDNEALFALIGTTYGGDGQNTFALPDLRGRLPIHQGGGFTIGQAGGDDAVALTAQQIPAHRHAWQASQAPSTASNPLDQLPAQASKPLYAAPTAVSAMAPEAMAATGGGQAHSNLQPYLCVSFIIALSGIFPSRD